VHQTLGVRGFVPVRCQPGFWACQPCPFASAGYRRATERSRPPVGKTEIVGWGDARPSGDDRFLKEKDIVDNLVEVVEAGLGAAGIFPRSAE
jgi:hypothetical protein